MEHSSRLANFFLIIIIVAEGGEGNQLPGGEEMVKVS
jgi:hypothetical protein